MYIAECEQVHGSMFVWLERDRHHKVRGQQLNDGVGPVGGLFHLAIAVPSMIVFLAEASTPPPQYPSKHNFQFPIHSCIFKVVKQLLKWLSDLLQSCVYIRRFTDCETLSPFGLSFLP